MSGWFKFSRSLAAVCEGKPNVAAVAAQIGRRARFEAGPVRNKHGDIVDLNVGEAVFSWDELARVCGITESQTRTAVDYLQKHGQIAHKGTKRGSRVKALWLLENDDADARESQTASQSVSQSGSQSVSQSGSQLSRIQKKEQRKKKNEGEPLPLSWVPSDDLRKKAQEAGISELEFAEDIQRFVNKARSRGMTSHDWDADADTWISRFVERRREEQQAAPAKEEPRWVPDLFEEDRNEAVANLKRVFEQTQAAPTRDRVGELRDALERAERLNAVNSWSIGEVLLVRGEMGEEVVTICWSDLEAASEAA